MTKCQVILVLTVSTVVIVAARLFCGCENQQGNVESGYTGDEHLARIARQESARLEAAFRLQSPPLTTVRWGAYSCIPVVGVIQIAEAARGMPWFREHVRHEVMHTLIFGDSSAVIEIGAGTEMHPEIVNGVRVRSVVASWENE